MNDLKEIMLIHIANTKEVIRERKITIYHPNDIDQRFPISIYMDEENLVIYSWTPMKISPEASNKIALEFMPRE